ncbi:unnamed protein product [Phytophthora fragariaefolia]|uniref:Unnamed protein product n=1 Tax=Phytophthora fragariaefolia TaxID=1490495 RepID=A0A9W7CKQ9_9STRA|nr:unnamed protein product [Phytophthora fragariaefolia]
MTLLRAMAQRMDKLEQSNPKLENTLKEKQNGLRVDTFMTPTASPFALRLGMDTRMHIDSLTGSPRTPRRMTPPRRVEPVHQYFAAHHHIPRYQFPARSTSTPHSRQREKCLQFTHPGKAIAVTVKANVNVNRKDMCRASAIPARVRRNWPSGPSSARSSRSGFLEQVLQQAGGVVVVLDADAPVRHEKMMLETFKINITCAQAMQLFTAPKDTMRPWPEHYIFLMAVSAATDGGEYYLVLNNIVQYASADLRRVLTDKQLVSGAEWKPVGVKVWKSWAIEGLIPNKEEQKVPDLMVAVNESPIEPGRDWSLDSGSSCHLVNDQS